MRVAIVVAIVVGAYLIFEFGRIQANYNIVDAQAEQQEYRNQIEALDDEIAELKQQADDGRNPREIKVLLGKELVARFHGNVAADTALATFEARFQRGAVPDDMPDVRLSADGDGCSLVQVLKRSGLTSSTSEAMRMIQQGAVRIDGIRIEDKGLVLPESGSVVLQVGKRKFARVSFS